MRRWSALVVVASLALGTAADSPRRARRAYERAYRAHTRQIHVYTDFSTALNLKATYLDRDFRDALAAERARLIRPSDEDHARFVERMQTDGEMYHEVVFSAESGMPGKLRFGRSDDGWHLRLFADGVEQELVTAYRVRTPTPLHEGLYPHLTQWTDLWIARFHRTVDAPREVRLQVGSGYGNGQIVWSHDP